MQGNDPTDSGGRFSPYKIVDMGGMVMIVLARKQEAGKPQPKAARTGGQRRWRGSPFRVVDMGDTVLVVKKRPRRSRGGRGRNPRSRRGGRNRRPNPRRKSAPKAAE
jgi:hypothetical protein